MFHGNSIQDTRSLFFTSWHKHKNKQPLLPLEQQIVNVIIQHPEYHALFDKKATEHAYFPELGQTNPFLHLGLHLTIRDQIATNRPNGITAIYQQLLTAYKGDTSGVEHLLMEPLAECLWQAQRHHTLPDEIGYLSACRQLLHTP